MCCECDATVSFGGNERRDDAVGAWNHRAAVKGYNHDTTKLDEIRARYAVFHLFIRNFQYVVFKFIKYLVYKEMCRLILYFKVN